MFALLAGPAANAQTLRGFVRADSTAAPIVTADIWLDGTTVRTRSDRTGAYRLGGIGAGSYKLMVRAVGFRPLAVDAILAADDSIDVDLILTPIAVQLAPLEVNAAATEHLTATIRGFEERRAVGLGRFLTRADLARWEHGPVTAAMRMIAGVRLVLLPCGGWALATSRGSGPVQARPVYCTGPSGSYLVTPACYLSIYLDGVRQWSWGDEPPLDVDRIMVMDLEAIEVYRGPSELPTQYQGTGSACGAVLFWTRQK